MKVLLLLIPALLLSGCFRYVPHETIQTAYEICTPNEGLEYIQTVNDSDWLDVTCNNTAKFQIKIVRYTKD